MTPSTLSPIVSEFETQAQADAYEQWFKTKVQASMNSTRPRIAHADAVALLEKSLAQRKAIRTPSHVVA